MNNRNVNDLITNFIQIIWNETKVEQLDKFVHDDFIDHSLPPSLPSTKEGLKRWIALTDLSFKHNTVIEAQVVEDDSCIIKIRMNLEHIGQWRGIEPTGAMISTVGYRHFKTKDNKISGHWALIDGNSIENQLKDTANGCKIQQ